jgi:lipoteichoic acid synthase
MYKERFGFAVQHFAVSHLLLVALFWLIRLFEFFSLAALHLFARNEIPLVLGLAFDAWFIFVLALIVFPAYIITYMLIGPFTRFFLGIMFIGYVLIYIGLVSYFIITQVPLSVDFWGYSMADIRTTVNASTGISFISFVPFIIIIGLLFYYYPKAQEIILPRWAMVVYYSAAVVFGGFYIIKTPEMNWFSKESRYTLSINKMAYFGEKTATWYLEKNRAVEAQDSEYPFMKDADTTDVLSPFFNPLNAQPNFVFLMVEGLGGTFVGPNAYYGGCTPFIDSLAQHSLYWQYTLSATGRTFGVLPSLFGSLPYNEKGFMETAPDMPTHLSLFKLLKEQGYATHYFYGGNANFDLQDVFLEAQGIDYILEESKFPQSYQKLAANSEGFSWGYSDEDVFRRSLELFPGDHAKPTLSVYMTLNTHEPFQVPNQERYLEQLKKITQGKSPEKQKAYKEFPSEFSALLYTDNAIRQFMEQYKKRADYANTIFIITGDHRMIPVTQTSRIDRFHVPLLVFSPKLKRSQLFSSVNTHHDVTPTLLAFLSHQTTMKFPERVHWLGSIMDTTHTFHSTRKMALMRNKNELVDYIDGEYFFSDKSVYKITPNFDLEVSTDEKEATQLKNELEVFKQKNQYVFKQNKLYNDSISPVLVKKEFILTPRELQVLHFLGTDTMNPEQQLATAKMCAAANNYKITRLICKKTLLSSPNYEDMRLLLGRTYLWEGDYETAGKYFEESRRRSPNSGQPWKALIEKEMRVKNYQKAIELSNEAYLRFQNPDFIELKQNAVKAKSITKRNG